MNRRIGIKPPVTSDLFGQFPGFGTIARDEYARKSELLEDKVAAATAPSPAAAAAAAGR